MTEHDLDEIGRNILFSIIIPVIAINDYIRETVAHLQANSLKNWELFIVTDYVAETEWTTDPRIKLLESGHVGPAAKRDLGASFAHGTFLVFLDDDSFPRNDFLERLELSFSLEDAEAIGGPGLTPPDDGFWEQVSGATFEVRWVSSDPRRYRSIGSPLYVEDWPSVNLSIKRSVFNEVGGFDSDHWPGEDTLFCLKLARLKKKIKYDPEVVVYHHRRSGFRKHLKQVGGYGLHRGYFARTMPENSRKIRYFIPSLFSLYILLMPFFNFIGVHQIFLLIPFATYLIALAYFILQITQSRNLMIALFASVYLISSHFWYGIKFLKGFCLTKKLVSQLRA